MVTKGDLAELWLAINPVIHKHDAASLKASKRPEGQRGLGPAQRVVSAYQPLAGLEAAGTDRR